ncbi:MAG TPA: polysaccharide biosynthesis/export family protein [Candidatus Polarisedimenticolia bacterium]|jgi:polysaccharide export outer membrane protein|nr:polysaccharide biosynthesis/export family protein [Candidatus Polarisedimenticolia bacterium]
MTKRGFGPAAVVRVGILSVLAVLGGLISPVPAADPSPQPPAAETKPAPDARPPVEAKATPPEDTEYRIGVEDILAISVWRDPDLTREVPVRPDGRISLPLLQDIDAAGKTPKELALDIQRRLKEFLSNPSVTVIVREVNSLKAYYLGEVLKPGPILLRSQVRLLQGIALAGGLTPYGGRGSIVLYRKTATGEKVIELSYREIVGGRKPEDNLMLEPGDTVVVR